MNDIDIIERELEKLVVDADTLLSNSTVEEVELQNIKKRYFSLLIRLIDINVNATVTELAKNGIRITINRIEGKVNQFLYNFWNMYDVITYQAPYLLKHTDSDYRKKYLLEMKMKTNGILHNLKLLKIIKQRASH